MSQPLQTGQRATPRLDLQFVDGLRALAALGVAVYHSLLFSGTTADVDSLPLPLKALTFGHFGVCVFITLSGFVLMLPIAATKSLTMKRGTWDYVKRRTRRIAPPYYAALALFLVMISVIPLLNRNSKTSWDSKIPVTPGGLISHLTMTHNLRESWNFQIFGPAWSVATEYQIYFLMPLILLPLWRRFGPAVTVGVAVAIGWALALIVPGLQGAHPWYLGVFSIGMLAAYVVARGIRIPGLNRVTVIAVIGTLIVFAAGKPVVDRYQWVSELVLGGTIALVLVRLSRSQLDDEPNRARNILESKPLRSMGEWSYSLYLIHSPFLALGNLLILEHFSVSPIAHFLIEVFVVLPIALVISYGFYRVVEIRFMTSHQRQASTEATVKA